MSSNRGTKRRIILTVFSAFLILFATARPVQAFFGIDMAALIVYFRTEVFTPAPAGSFQSRLNETILGNATGVNGSYPLQVGGESIRGATTYRSLTEYFEQVWWPKFVSVNQVMAKENAGKEALAMSNDGRLADADNQVDYKSNINQNDWDIQSDLLGAEDVLCGPASLSQSQTLLDELSRQMRTDLDVASIGKRSGNPAAAGPNASNGPNQYNMEAVQETQSGGCDPAGNAGANAKWCAGPADQAGYHVSASTLMGQTALTSAAGKVNSTKYATMFLERVFPNYFSPIRPDLLDPLTSEAAEVINKQDNYKAVLSIFGYPFHKMQADNNPFQSIGSADYLKKALIRTGIPESMLADVLGSDGITKAGADRVLYKDYMRDPKTMMENGTWNASNVLRMNTVTNMNQVVLLYDIREEIKTTNALLGAIGSVLTRDTYNEVQGKTAAIAR